jgi:transcriptional adapter 2-alpha
MDLHFDIDPEEFQERKRRRIADMNTVATPAQKVAPTSAPGVHEIATFLPGRLEFEHELDNDAEDLVKDLEFGICLEWGGDQIVEDEQDPDVRVRAKIAEERRNGFVVPNVTKSLPAGKGPPAPQTNGSINGYHINGDIKKDIKSEDVTMANGTAVDDEEEPTLPPPYESKDSLNFKLTLLEMYAQRVEKRHESKGMMFERGLLDYKKVMHRASYLKSF